MTDIFEVGLPCSVDTERMVLGSMLINRARVDGVLAELSEDDFSTETHRRIYRAIRARAEANEGIDLHTVAVWFHDRQQLDSVGGLSYLADLTNGMPDLSSVDSYIRILRDKSVRRQAIMAATRLVHRLVSEPDDSTEILADAERFLAQLGDSRNGHGEWITAREVIDRYPGKLNGFLNPSHSGIGIPTPWPRLTEMLCGFQPGDFVVLAGRPSMGKSIIAMQCAYRAARHNVGCGYISLEMSKESLVQRQICSDASVDHQSFRSGHLSKEERLRLSKAAEAIQDVPVFIDDTRARTPSAVTAAFRKLQAKAEIRMLFLDHCQLMRGAGRYSNRHAELSEISNSLAHLAKDNKVAVVLVSQLNRDCERENRRPQLSDLKETGTLEEDADTVLFVHRPERYRREDPSLRGKAELLVAKQRNGPIGKINMTFLHGFQRFEEAAPEEAAA